MQIRAVSRQACRGHTILRLGGQASVSDGATARWPLAKAEKKEIKIISEAKIVPSGIVHLIELQRQGYAYVKP